MNRIILFSLILLTACGGSSKDPKTQLEDLKKQEADIKSQIVKLEDELSKRLVVGTIAKTSRNDRDQFSA